MPNCISENVTLNIQMCMYNILNFPQVHLPLLLYLINLVHQTFQVKVHGNDSDTGQADARNFHDDLVSEVVEDNAENFWAALDEVGTILMELGWRKAGFWVKHGREDRSRGGQQCGAGCLKMSSANIQLYNVVQRHFNFSCRSESSNI